MMDHTARSARGTTEIAARLRDLAARIDAGCGPPDAHQRMLAEFPGLEGWQRAIAHALVVLADEVERPLARVEVAAGLVVGPGEVLVVKLSGRRHSVAELAKLSGTLRYYLGDRALIIEEGEPGTVELVKVAQEAVLPDGRRGAVAAGPLEEAVQTPQDDGSRDAQAREEYEAEQARGRALEAAQREGPWPEEEVG